MDLSIALFLIQQSIANSQIHLQILNVVDLYAQECGGYNMMDWGRLKRRLEETGLDSSSANRCVKNLRLKFEPLEVVVQRCSRLLNTRPEKIQKFVSGCVRPTLKRMKKYLKHTIHDGQRHMLVSEIKKLELFRDWLLSTVPKKRKSEHVNVQPTKRIKNSGLVLGMCPNIFRYIFSFLDLESLLKIRILNNNYLSMIHNPNCRDLWYDCQELKTICFEIRYFTVYPHFHAPWIKRFLVFNRDLFPFNQILGYALHKSKTEFLDSESEMMVVYEQKTTERMLMKIFNSIQIEDLALEINPCDYGDNETTVVSMIDNCDIEKIMVLNFIKDKLNNTILPKIKTLRYGNNTYPITLEHPLEKRLLDLVPDRWQ
jgi:hypothetical protein